MNWWSPVTIYNASKMNVLARVSSDSITEQKRKQVPCTFTTEPLLEKYLQTTKSGYSVVERFSRVDFFPEKSKDTAYVSIKPHDDGKGRYMHLCEDHPVKRDCHGVIITENFYIRIAKGEWVDTEGKSYKPPENPSRAGPEPTGLTSLRTKHSNLENTRGINAEDGNENTVSSSSYFSTN